MWDHVGGHYARLALGLGTEDDQRAPAVGCVFCGGALCKLALTAAPRGAIKVHVADRPCFGFISLRIGDYHLKDQSLSGGEMCPCSAQCARWSWAAPAMLYTGQMRVMGATCPLR